MNVIKEVEKVKYLGEDGLKLFYYNDSNAKEYNAHMDVLNAIAEDYAQVSIFIINKEISSSENGKSGSSGTDGYTFELYENSQLLKSFVNCAVGTVTAFLRKHIASEGTNRKVGENSEDDEEEDEEDTVKKIENLLKSEKIILFMKGSKTFPQCRFSNAVVYILNSLKIKYSTYNILEDDDVRSQLKIYSNWPTYPQLYINGELIGGHDIIKSMYDSNELKGLIPQDCFEE
ncbi:glutaredoxin-like protein, putative [Plasmodium ovale]|uniref:Glutaredoxin-like protein (GLP2) n=2 Tax=Plasmodium ovale TaxID=36330 RepID=A0A1A8W350_PLAOA|nr:glutaredoxin-like protein (GLP2) [Plasmodium ovale curtisi]SBS95445.1 glutaredoxin-like protein (GLP2) [Plasmodium ovale curtisi]SCP05193.1 glutaredoxin-like protein, putative [Plasmodium ovale]